MCIRDSSYSNIVVVERRIEGGITLFPNPTKDQLTVTFEVQKAQTVDLHLYDALGRRIMEESISVNTALNNYELNTSSLSEGVYILKIVGERVDLEHKFIKVN